METTPEVFLLHLRVGGFFGNLAALFIGSFHIGGMLLQSGEYSVLMPTSMILFIWRLMPGEPPPQSNGETQRSEIYFTNHTLTGKRTSLRS